MYLTARRVADELELTLSGEWHALRFSEIEIELGAVDLADVRSVNVIAGQAQLDLTGAWLLRDFVDRTRAAGTAVEFQGGEPATLALVERCNTGEMHAHAHLHLHLHDLESAPAHALEGVGRQAVRALQSIDDGLTFIGRLSVAFAHGWATMRLRPVSTARHVYDTGVTAVPIVSLIAFLISVILAYMGAQQLSKFGADIFVVDLVTVGVLRELGVLLTAIIVAGRSGSAFAAEIGAMQLNEEVDALRAIGVDPIEVLVLPRLFGLVIALPLLTVLADLIGLVGGGLLCHVLLGMPLVQYLNRAQSAIASTTFWVGIVKAPVFACLIAISGCYCGMRVRDSSRELGRLTTLAVVQSIFFVILVDALFAVLFMELDV
ncbi:MAG TPA: ABC transporter permease [Steroidobacteraceae bacterium]|jgi:phospholipid/cholesterol/gamma-HCH transport system permease protein|nr:ABC transporter permease [Steroidobacteraceae bacterium]